MPRSDRKWRVMDESKGKEMRRLIMVLAAVTTVAVPVGVATVVLAPASNAAVSLTCAKLKGSESGSVSVSKCAVPKADKKTFKTLSAQNATALATGGTLTWSSSGAHVTISAPHLTSGPAGACPSKDTTETATGTVAVGDGVVTHNGDTFKTTVCITSKGKIKNAKGTVVEL